MTPPTIRQRRFRALLEQMRAAGETNASIAKRLKISPGLVSQILLGNKEAGEETIDKAKSILKIDEDFFSRSTDGARYVAFVKRSPLRASGDPYPSFEAYIEREAEEGRSLPEVHAAVLRAARLPGGEHAATEELAEQIAIALRKADRLQSAITPPAPPARSSTRRKAAS